MKKTIIFLLFLLVFLLCFSFSTKAEHRAGGSSWDGFWYEGYRVENTTIENITNIGDALDGGTGYDDVLSYATFNNKVVFHACLSNFSMGCEYCSQDNYTIADLELYTVAKSNYNTNVAFNITPVLDNVSLSTSHTWTTDHYRTYYYYDLISTTPNKTSPWYVDDLYNLTFKINSNDANDLYIHAVGFTYNYILPNEILKYNGGKWNTTSIEIYYQRATYSDYQYFEYNTSSSDWNAGEGVYVNNITHQVGDVYLTETITGLTPGTRYFLKGWGGTSDNSQLSYHPVTISFITKPLPPTNAYINDTSGLNLNLTWTKATNTNNTVVVKKLGNYPTSVDDGTIVYNDTGSFVIDTVSTSTTPFYYSLWSYFESDGNYSFSDSYETLSIGGLLLNCYDVNTSTNITNWNVFITNADGSTTYNSSSNNNPFFVNNSELPSEKCSITFSKIGYDDALYYVNIEDGSFYVVDGFLHDENDTEIYRIEILGLQRDYGTSDTVEDARLDFKRYINNSWQSIGVYYTDANGNVYIRLSEEMYKLNITADGYITQNVDFTPTPDVGVYTFRLIPISAIGNQTLWTEYFTPTVEATLTKLFINTTDSSNTLTSIQLVVYSMNNSTGVLTPIYWHNDTSNLALEIDIEPATTYIVNIATNTSLLDIRVNFSEILITPTSPYRNQVTPSNINALLEANYGTNPLGWSNTIAFLLICAGLFAFGEQGVGITLIGTGFMFLFINSIIGIVAIGTLIPILFIVFGIFTEWIRHQNKGVR